MGRITSSAAVQRTRWIQYLAPGILFVLALYTKPSMVAAPLAGSLWLLFGRWANLSLATRFGVALAWGLLAALPLALLQWASDGWFWVHVVWGQRQSLGRRARQPDLGRPAAPALAALRRWRARRPHLPFRAVETLRGSVTSTVRRSLGLRAWRPRRRNRRGQGRRRRQLLPRALRRARVGWLA